MIKRNRKDLEFTPWCIVPNLFIDKYPLQSQYQQ
nr:MAG TPA: hypothetical protein [Caudoviricetes sp.]